MSGEKIGCTCSARTGEDHYYYCPLTEHPEESPLAETEPYLASGIRTCRVCECRMADVCFGCNRENYDLGGIHAALEQPERLCDDLFFAGRALAREVERLIRTNDGEPATLRAALKLYREHDPDVLRDYSDVDLIAMAENTHCKFCLETVCTCPAKK